MRVSRLAVGVIGIVASVMTVFAAPAPASPEAIEGILKTMEAPYASEAPRLIQDKANGYIRFLGAPPGGRFVAPAMTKTSDPVANALEFITRHKGAFAAPDPESEVVVDRVNASDGRHYVRMRQTYGGLEVFGSGITVQVSADGGIVSVLSDVMQGVNEGQTPFQLTPLIGTAVAQQFAIQRIRADVPETSGLELVASSPELKVYDPAVVGDQGLTRLAYYIEVSSPDHIGIKRAVFVDARTGQIPAHWSLFHDARNRRIFDGGFWFLLDGLLVRSEGDPPTGIKDVDEAYDYLGDTYDFYFEHHDRDAIDGLGGTMSAYVRTLDFGGLAFLNAGWDGEHMVFGQGFTADDVTAHELTHGVTQHTSDLIYFFESGAINESFSDMWGEWIDLTNGAGDDSDEVRWLMGEDIPSLGVIRNMADPTEFGDPDRYSEYLNYPIFFDNGGVHFNSGIGNKLCYLLTDGDMFNGQTVEGMGIVRTAKLMYEVQSNLLVPSSDYYDLFAALSQASINLGFSFQERLNLRAAMAAVEIVPESAQTSLENFRATPAYTAEGIPVSILTWKNPDVDSEIAATLVRSTKRFIDTVPAPDAQSEADGIVVFEGDASMFVDGIEFPVEQGRDYFYSLFVDVQGGLPYAEFTRVTAGENPPEFLTEVFTSGFDGAPANAVDLAFKQLLFTPLADPAKARASGKIGDYYNFTNYSVAVKHNVTALPVAKNDGDGQATFLPMGDDDYITYTFGSFAFPYFGVPYRRASVASNGYIAFEPLSVSSSSNFPSLDAHMDQPRISFLFADLAPNAGGTVWGRALDDRLAITFDRVPEYTFFSNGVAPGPNTVQVELFYSGHIRITYLGLDVDEAVVGLSDGNGAFPDIESLLPGSPSTVEQTDLSKAAAQLSQALDIWPPVPLQIVNEGEIVHFNVNTVSPAGTVPVLTASWDREDLVPFADRFDGTGEFSWYTGYEDGGLQTVEIIAKTDTEIASQVVSILVVDTTAAPEAHNLRLGSDDPDEDPTESRPVSARMPLTASYEYFHPEATRDPLVFGEGRTLIYWFRNGLLVSSQINARQVPPGVTRAGDEWYFTVTPETEFGVMGATYTSPTVTIVDQPLIHEVSPISGPMTGGTAVTIRGYNLDRPMRVRFGGFNAQGIQSISDEELIAISPVHAPGTVEIEVDTPDGTARMASAFTFGDTGGSIIKADIDGDGSITAVDVQLVINGVLGTEKNHDVDANRDGVVNAADIQVVVNALLAATQ